MSSLFSDTTPCSPLKVNWRLGGTYSHHLQVRRISWARNQHESRWQAMLVCCSAYPSTLKIKVTCSSETSVDFQRTTRRYIPEDRQNSSWPPLWETQILQITWFRHDNWVVEGGYIPLFRSGEHVLQIQCILLNLSLQHQWDDRYRST
jgi:hypothetical protein